MDHDYEKQLPAQDEDWAREIEEDLFDDTIAQSLKSPERVGREKRFVALYEAYMHPREPLSDWRRQCLLDDLYTLLCELHRSWARSKCSRYRAAGFTEVDPELAISIGCSWVYPILREDQENGRYCAYPVAHYLKIARTKTVDHYFRKEFKRLPPRKKNDPQTEQEETAARKRDAYLVSLEGMAVDDHGVYLEDRNRALVCDPFSEPRLPRRLSDQKCGRLSALYLRELMDYPGEPQKPLAVMYGSVLYQLAREREGSRLAEAAAKSSRLTSAPWAHQAMAHYNLEQLGSISERIVSRCYGQALPWGEPFRAQMPRRAGYGLDTTWGQVVYTAAFTTDDTSDWIESIFASTIKKCGRKLAADRDLRDFAADTLSYKGKLRRAVAAIEKKREASR